MFGKSFYEMSTDIGNDQLLEILEQWSKNCKLKDVSTGNKSKNYRFGNPFVSNPIYIEIFYTDRPIKIFGGVQTLIFIFLIREKRMAILHRIDPIYLLLAIPAVYGIFLVQQEQKAVQYTIFLGIFLAYLALEALYDFILKISFRQNWKLLTPYLCLYYAMNYGFVVMVWKTYL